LIEGWDWKEKSISKKTKRIQKNEDRNQLKKSKECFYWRVKLKKIITLTKNIKKKIRNQNNKDKIEKHNTINLNWKMKLKTNKIYTKSSR